MNTNETKNENTVQKPCSNTSKSGANVDKSRGSGKRMNMSPMMQEYCKTKEEYKDCILFYDEEYFLQNQPKPSVPVRENGPRRAMPAGL